MVMTLHLLEAFRVSDPARVTLAFSNAPILRTSSCGNHYLAARIHDIHTIMTNSECLDAFQYHNENKHNQNPPMTHLLLKLTK